MRDVISVLRPETSAGHKRMDHPSFLTQDDASLPFLWALNSFDTPCANYLMRSIAFETQDSAMYINMDKLNYRLPKARYVVPIDAEAVADRLHGTTASPARKVMAEYIRQLARSVTTIMEASNAKVPAMNKLLWTSNIRLFITSVAATLKIMPQRYLAIFLTEKTVSITISLALGEYTRDNDNINPYFMVDAVMFSAVQWNQKHFSWVPIFNKYINPLMTAFTESVNCHYGFSEIVC